MSAVPFIRKTKFSIRSKQEPKLCVYFKHTKGLKEGKSLFLSVQWRQLLQHCCKVLNLNTRLQAPQFRYLPTYFPDEHILTFVAINCTRNDVTTWLGVLCCCKVSSLMCLLHFSLHNSTWLLRLVQKTCQPAKSAVPEHSIATCHRMDFNGNSVSRHKTREPRCKGSNWNIRK